MPAPLIAITGSSGYLGKLVAAQLKDTHRIIEISHSEQQANNSNYSRHLNLATATVDNVTRALTHRGEAAEAIVHLAALTSVPASYETPQLYDSVNAVGTRTLMEASAILGIRHVTFASSITVHGSNPRLPIRRETPVHPESPYAVSKAKAENYLQAGAAGGLGTAVSTIRFTNLSGKYPGANLKSGGVTAYLAKEIFKANPVTIASGYTTADTTAERDILDIRDAAKLVTRTLENPPPRGQVKTYPAGSGTTVSIEHIAQTLGRLTGNPLYIDRGPARTGEADRICIDTSQTRDELNWQPQYTLENTLESELESLASTQ